MQEIVASQPVVFIEALEMKLNVRHVPDEYIINGARPPEYAPINGAAVLDPSYIFRISPGAVAKLVKLI